MNDRGSILIESMVAAAVLALILGAAYQILGDASRRSARADLQRSALLVAQSRLATLPLDEPVSAGVSTGVIDGLQWRIAVEPREGSAMRVRVGVAERGARRPLASLESVRPGVRS